MKSDLLNDIKSYIETGEMSFLIGAGFSRNVSKEAYPLWGELLKDAIWQMFGSGKRSKQEEKVVGKAEKEYGYLGIASMLVRKAGYHEAIDAYIESKTPYIKTVNGRPVLVLNGKQLPNKVNAEAHLLLKGLNIQNIYTFNYDNALEFFMGEDAKRELEEKIKKTEKKIEGLYKKIDELGEEETSSKTKLNDSINELRANLETDRWSLKTYYNVVKDSSEISLSAKRKSIYKIHGSLREDADGEYGFDGDSHTQYIITQEDYDSYDVKHGAFVNMMRIDLLRNRFCIMGVSGGDANFLAWINWVKDVLDKTRARSMDKGQKPHQSYFIYSGDKEMPQDMVLMLRNHFIQPVVLKDCFPTSKSDEERIRCFLEYIQPFSNEKATRCAELWGKIDSPNPFFKPPKPIPQHTAEDLFVLSSGNKFNKPHSAIHSKANNVQFAVKSYLFPGAAMPERMVYAAALQCSMIPFDVAFNLEDKQTLGLMDKETDLAIKDVFVAGVRRAAILQNLDGLEKGLFEGDDYSKVLRDLYNFRFQAIKTVCLKSGNRGLDFVRKYSLSVLLQGDVSITDDLRCDDFQSPQELVLAADWLKHIGYKNPSLYKKAEELKQQLKLMGLKDYCQAYLAAMCRGEEVSSYGNVTEVVYLDHYVPNVINGAVLLNSFVELGICFAGNSVLSDTEWISVVKALKDRYPDALAFYTIARDSKEKVIKVVAQELMYNEHSRKKLPTMLRNLITSLVSANTPMHLKGKMALFATSILPAVNIKNWSRYFQNRAEEILNLADQCNRVTDIPKSMYGFVSAALNYVNNKTLRLTFLERILAKDGIDDRFEGHLNTLVISTRKKLTPTDFAPLFEKYLVFAKKVKQENNQMGFYVVMNLLVLVDNWQKPKILPLLEDRALLEASLTEGYSAQIKDYPLLNKSFKEKLLTREDLWRSGIDGTTISVGMENVEISQIDKYVIFDEKQVSYIYDDLKKVLGKISAVFNDPDHKKEDNAWLSPENDFREIVIDMRLFVHNHEKELKQKDDYEGTLRLLLSLYEQCFFNKNVFQLIAEDKIYRAIRRLMVESEIFGIDHFRVEYEQMLGRLIAKDTDKLGTLFRHMAWVMKNNPSFFNSDDFKILFGAVLSVYRPYFDTAEGEPLAWNLMGCQKETAENALITISKTMKEWGRKDDFWSRYQPVFDLAEKC